VQASNAARVERCRICGSGGHGVNAAGNRVTVVGNTIFTNGRTTGAFAGVQCAGADCAIDGNHITNMLLGGDDVGIDVTGTSNLIVRNQLSAPSTYVSIGAGNTIGGTFATPSTAGPWVNITF
jgi:hypothetical protein